MLLQRKKLMDCRRYKLYIFFLFCIAAIVLMYYSMFCEHWACHIQKPVLIQQDAYASKGKMKDRSVPPSLRTQTHLPRHHGSHDRVANHNRNVNIMNGFHEYDFHFNGNTVLVFLHMQKTGGTTFERQLVRNLANSPCHCYKGKKRCDCNTKEGNIWLFSRYSTGWACGLHADWTELKSCVNDEFLNKKEGKVRKRRLLYLTQLRSPMQRYISEWKHVRRGSTWYSARLACNGHQATLEEVPFCFDGKWSKERPQSSPKNPGENWEGVTLADFIACPHNLAADRQTRMLANLSLVGCYDKTVMPAEQRSATMLQSAKDNLRSMAYFGLVEYQRESQYLFERTFPPLHFTEAFSQVTRTHASAVDLSPKQLSGVAGRNTLDVKLYAFAHKLFFERLATARAMDPNWHDGNSYNGGTGVASLPEADDYDNGEDEDGAEWSKIT